MYYSNARNSYNEWAAVEAPCFDVTASDFIWNNGYENVMCKVSTILSLPDCVKCTKSNNILWQHITQEQKLRIKDGPHHSKYAVDELWIPCLGTCQLCRIIYVWLWYEPFIPLCTKRLITIRREVSKQQDCLLTWSHLLKFNRRCCRHACQISEGSILLNSYISRSIYIYIYISACVCVWTCV